MFGVGVEAVEVAGPRAGWLYLCSANTATILHQWQCCRGRPRSRSLSCTRVTAQRAQPHVSWPALRSYVKSILTLTGVTIHPTTATDCHPPVRATLP